MKINLDYLISIVSKYKYYVIFLSIVTSSTYCIYYFNDKIKKHEIQVVIEHNTTSYIEEYKNIIKALDLIKFNESTIDYFQNIKSYSSASFHKKFINNITFDDFLLYVNRDIEKLNFIDINVIYELIELNTAAGMSYRFEKSLKISSKNIKTLNDFLYGYFNFVNQSTSQYFTKLLNDELTIFNLNQSQKINKLFSILLNEHFFIIMNQIQNLKSEIELIHNDYDTITINDFNKLNAIKNILSKYNKIKIEIDNINKIYKLDYFIPKYNVDEKVSKKLISDFDKIITDLDSNLDNSEKLLFNLIQKTDNKNKRYSLYNSVNLKLIELNKILELYANLNKFDQNKISNEIISTDIFINIKPQTNYYGMYIDTVLFFIIVFVFASFFFIFILLNIFIFFIKKD